MVSFEPCLAEDRLVSAVLQQIGGQLRNGLLRLCKYHQAANARNGPESVGGRRHAGLVCNTVTSAATHEHAGVGAVALRQLMRFGPGDFWNPNLIYFIPPASPPTSRLCKSRRDHFLGANSARWGHRDRPGAVDAAKASSRWNPNPDGGVSALAVEGRGTGGLCVTRCKQAETRRFDAVYWHAADWNPDADGEFWPWLRLEHIYAAQFFEHQRHPGSHLARWTAIVSLLLDNPLRTDVAPGVVEALYQAGFYILGDDATLTALTPAQVNADELAPWRDGTLPIAPRQHHFTRKIS